MKTMEELAREIVENHRRASDAQLAAALAAAEAKRRYFAGDIDGCETWEIWVTRKTRVALRTVDELAKIGGSNDPEAALFAVRERKKQSERRRRRQKVAPRGASENRGFAPPDREASPLPDNTDRQSHDFSVLSAGWNNACAEARWQFLQWTWIYAPDDARWQFLQWVLGEADEQLRARLSHDLGIKPRVLASAA